MNESITSAPDQLTDRERLFDFMLNMEGVDADNTEHRQQVQSTIDGADEDKMELLLGLMEQSLAARQAEDNGTCDLLTGVEAPDDSYEVSNDFAAHLGDDGFDNN